MALGTRPQGLNCPVLCLLMSSYCNVSFTCLQLDGRNILVREDRGGFQHDGDSPPRRARGEFGDRGDYGRRERSRSPMAAPADMQCYEVQTLNFEHACMPRITAPRCLTRSTAVAAADQLCPEKSRATCTSNRQCLASSEQLLRFGRFPQSVVRRWRLQCGEYGHRARDCPNRGQGGGRGFQRREEGSRYPPRSGRQVRAG